MNEYFEEDFDFTDTQKVLSEFKKYCEECVKSNHPMIFKKPKTASEKKIFSNKRYNAQLEAKNKSIELMNKIDELGLPKDKKEEIDKLLIREVEKVWFTFDRTFG